MSTKAAIERLQTEIDSSRSILQMLEENPTEMSRFSVPLVNSIIEKSEETIRCVEEGKPFISSIFNVAPEIYVAMDLHWNCIFATALMGISTPFVLDEIDGCERIGLGTEMCTALRLGPYMVEAGLCPIPTALIAVIGPCDASNQAHQAIVENKDWRNVPVFVSDPPYFEDERSIDYYAGELKQMVTFLEEHTGKKLDIDRLREVVEEVNKECELWAEYNEMRRVVPCPHGWDMLVQAWTVAGHEFIGDPRGTAWFRDLIADAEERVRAKRGWLDNERIRVHWFGLRPEWIFELLPWLEQEWGANVVMDMFGYTPYTRIDTSSEDAMFKGLAKKSLFHVPMARHSQGPADDYVKDLVRVVKDYKVDCVVFPDQMGHKDGSASVGLMREACRNNRVPFLSIPVDLFDHRYTTVDEIKAKLSQFFTAMGLG